MSWFNYYGLIYVAVIMIPNIIFAIKNPNGYQNTYRNKAAEIFEQIGRYACMAFMIFNVPYTYIGFYFSYAEITYIVVNAVLVLIYCAIWGVLWKKSGIVKALLLSVIPSLIFLFSGIMIASIPLVVFAVIFAVAHILISVKNALLSESSANVKRKSVVAVLSVVLALIFTVACCLGGAAIYAQSRLVNLDGMSVSDMINYDCSNKNAKISIAVIENGNVTYRTYGSGGEENTLYDYEIGSVSKTFVGLLCAKAVYEGKLNLSDSVSKYLNLDGDKYYPTVERLLTHTSGYAPYYFESSMIGNKFAQISNDFYGISKTQILNKVKNISLEDKDYPFVYSNFGISVVGLALEKIYNDNFINLMNDYIKNELNLASTRVAAQSGNLDKYWKWKNDDGYVPAGAIVSNIEDMANYLNVYMTDRLAYASDTYAAIKDIDVSNEAYEKLNIRTDAVGMTWMLDDKNGIVWHNGSTTDFNSYAGFTKDGQKGVVILSNLNSADGISMTVIGAKILTDNYSF
ncbi:MAG: beta-lactamase family protein [Firmicutes bacterium]|nr:beta-lactamase family protein [Bacillota bacterium]